MMPIINCFINANGLLRYADIPVGSDAGIVNNMMTPQIFISGNPGGIVACTENARINTIKIKEEYRNKLSLT